MPSRRVLPRLRRSCSRKERTTSVRSCDVWSHDGPGTRSWGRRFMCTSLCDRDWRLCLNERIPALVALAKGQLTEGLPHDAACGMSPNSNTSPNSVLFLKDDHRPRSKAPAEQIAACDAGRALSLRPPARTSSTRRLRSWRCPTRGSKPRSTSDRTGSRSRSRSVPRRAPSVPGWSRCWP